MSESITVQGIAPAHVTTGRDLAAKTLERVDALRLTGAKADAEALAFICGAATLATMQGNHDLADYLGCIAFYYVAPRGMFGVREYLAGVQKNQAGA